MLDLPTWGWTLFALAAAATVLGVLHVLACGVRNDTSLHDLRVRTAALRKHHLERQNRLARQAVDGSKKPVEVSEDIDQSPRQAA